MSESKPALGLLPCEVISYRGKLFAVSEFSNDTVFGYPDRRIEYIVEMRSDEVQTVTDGDGQISGYNWTPDVNIARLTGAKCEKDGSAIDEKWFYSAPTVVKDSYTLDQGEYWFSEGKLNYADFCDFIERIGVKRVKGITDNKSDPIARRNDVIASLRGEPVDIPYIIYDDSMSVVDGTQKEIGLPASANAPCESMKPVGWSSSEYIVPNRTACVVQIKNNNPYDFCISEAEIKDGGDPGKIYNVLSLPDNVLGKRDGKSQGFNDKSFYAYTISCHDPCGSELLDFSNTGNAYNFNALARYTATGCIDDADPERNKVFHRFGQVGEAEAKKLQLIASAWLPEFDTACLPDGSLNISDRATRDKQQIAECERSVKWHVIEMDRRLVKRGHGESSICYIVPSENGSYHINAGDAELSQSWNGHFDVYISDAVYTPSYFKHTDNGTTVLRTFGDNYISKDMRDAVDAFNNLDSDARNQICTVLSKFDPCWSVEDLQNRKVKECVISDGCILGEGKTIFDQMEEYYAEDIEKAARESESNGQSIV